MQLEASVRQPFELVEQLREDAEVAAPSELEAPPSRVIYRVPFTECRSRRVSKVCWRCDASTRPARSSDPRRTSLGTRWGSGWGRSGLPGKRPGTPLDYQGSNCAISRHEAGSRFDEAGVPTNYVSKLLGHTNLTTTSRYLNIHRRGLQLAMQKLEEHRAGQKSVAHALHKDQENAPAVAPASDDHPVSKQLPF